jgi:hypothetical protein
MTTDHDIERVLDRWFTDGPTRMPDRFLDDTLGRIDYSRRPVLSSLRTWAGSMDARLRFGVAAAVVLAVVGVGAGLRLGAPENPSSGGIGAVPAALQAEWRPVEPRQHLTPAGNSNPLDLDIVIDADTITIFDFHGDVASSATLVGPDRLDLRTLDSPATTEGDQSGTQVLKPNWDCRVGDLATYTFRLSPSGLDLTLTPVSDACAARATILAGDWFRTDNGALAPGRHEATLFKPFDSGTAGRFSFTVPPGWAVVGEQTSSETTIALGTSPSESKVIILATARPTRPQVACGGELADIAERAWQDAVVDATPSGYARWLADRGGLVVSTPTPVTIGSLGGVMVDASVDQVRASACGDSVVETFYKAVERVVQPGVSTALGLHIAGEERARYYLLDAGPGVVLLIAVEAPDQASWEAAIADATPVIESFEFAR